MTAQVLAPITIVNAMVTACAVAEPDTTQGEVVWDPTHNYSIGNMVIRTTTHRKYANLIAGVDATLPETVPNNRWFDSGPTNKWAAFDNYRSTAITYTGTLTMTVKPGIITGMQFFGLVGDTIRVVCKNASSLAVYSDVTYSLATYLSGDLMWSFYFDTARQQDSLRISDLYPQDSQVEITLTPSSTAGVAAIGIWVLGSFNYIGLPTFGFKAQPVDYTPITVDKYGNTVATKGLSAKNLVGDCALLKPADAEATADVVYQLLGIPCAWVMSASGVGFDYLSAFGFGSADVTATSPTTATLSLTVRGLI